MTEKILLQRQVTPKEVTLPNGQTFYARYERTSHEIYRETLQLQKIEQLGQDHNELEKIKEVEVY